jgi:hypothetical protein
VGLQGGGTLGEFLWKYGDPEFNNPSGLYSVIYDLGLPLGLLFFGVVGLFAGRCFTAYRAGSLLGVLAYPLFFLSFLEIFRYFYLGNSRGFTWALGIGVALVVGKLWRKETGALAEQPSTGTLAEQPSTFVSGTGWSE